jgi:CheY-like chemotaxis protein
MGETNFITRNLGATTGLTRAPHNCRLGSRRHQRPCALIVDDDDGTLDIVGDVLRRVGVDVEVAHTGAAALTLIDAREVDVLLIDLRLPDMSGLDLLTHMQRSKAALPFILMSGFMTVDKATEAMRRGAVDVIEKPIDIDKLLLTVLAVLQTHNGLPSREVVNDFLLARSPQSVAERWAQYVWKACQSSGDLKTLAVWARVVGVSYSGLCETCRLLSIRPHAARDFTRVLRVVVQSGSLGCAPEVLLDISDRRTLRSLFDRAGLSVGYESSPETLPQFLLRQTFVPEHNEGFATLRRIIETSIQRQRP